MVVKFNGTQESFYKIKKIEFYGSDGKKIEARIVGTSKSGRGMQAKCSKTYRLAKKVKTATLAVTYFPKIEQLNIPLDLTISVGLGKAENAGGASTPDSPKTEPPATEKKPATTTVTKTKKITVTKVKDPEKTANSYLAMASNYLAAGKTDKAIEVYKIIVMDYPGTKAAGIAKQKLKELQAK